MNVFRRRSPSDLDEEILQSEAVDEPLDVDDLEDESDVRRRRRRRLQWIKRHQLGLIGIFLVGLMVLAAALGPILLDVDPNAQDLRARLLTPFSTSESGTFYLLGTDANGRDVFARVLAGGRVSLGVAGLGLLLGCSIGLIMGVASGFYGGLTDNAIMRFVDAQLALPVLISAMFIATILGTGFWNTGLTLGFAGWPIYARLIRADVLKIREEEYLEAGISMGGNDGWLLGRHVLPNLISAVAVVASLEMGRLILIESGLSYLGMGMQPPDASWGSMIRSAQSYIFIAPHLSIVPGVAIVATVLGLNLLGDWVRDILDPRID